MTWQMKAIVAIALSILFLAIWEIWFMNPPPPARSAKIKQPALAPMIRVLDGHPCNRVNWGAWTYREKDRILFQCNKTRRGLEWKRFR